MRRIKGLILKSVICNLLILVPMLCIGTNNPLSPLTKWELKRDVAFAVEVAPRISDKEIIESLVELKAGQKAIDKRFDDVNRRFDDMNNSVNKRFDDTNRRIDDLKESTTKQFNILQWMFGIFITVSLAIFGVIGKLLWNQEGRLKEIETSLEAQKEEISFLKTLIEKLQTLIEKLLPPRGVL